jgi:methionyl-tRNA formyltransferase
VNKANRGNGVCDAKVPMPALMSFDSTAGREPMRVYFLLDDDYMYKPPMLSRVIEKCPEGVQIIGVGGVVHNLKGNGWAGLVRNIRFWGARGTLLIVSRYTTGRLFGRSLSSIGNRFHIPFEKVINVNAPEFLSRLRGMRPDVLVSFQHQIFKRDLLAIPRLACINCHPGALPKYRGVMPLFWAMLADEECFGVTVHTMTERIDVGYVVVQKMWRRLRRTTLLQAYADAYNVASDAISEALSAMQRFTASDTRKTVGADTPYHRMPAAEDRRRFLAGGHRLG